MKSYNVLSGEIGKNGQIDPFPPILIDHPNAGAI